MGTASISKLLGQAVRIKVFDVDYYHLSLPGGDDLYVTEYGLPFIENLLPENFWTDKKWFKEHSEKLRGTSTLYRVMTKEINGKSKGIVIMESYGPGHSWFIRPERIEHRIQQYL